MPARRTVPPETKRRATKAAAAPRRRQYTRWGDLKHRMTPEERDERRRAVVQELIELDLQELRRFVGMTQVQLAQAIKMTQAQVSQIEGRGDHLLSTLQRVVHALGGDLEIWARFCNRSVRVRALG
ncbi:MAG: helix-turn-helix domain-containing protein [Candidatus Binatia bacterium]